MTFQARYAGQSLKSIRQERATGYIDIFAAAMTGIHNPKAQDNKVIDEEQSILLNPRAARPFARH